MACGDTERTKSPLARREVFFRFPFSAALRPPVNKLNSKFTLPSSVCLDGAINKKPINLPIEITLTSWGRKREKKTIRCEATVSYIHLCVECFFDLGNREKGIAE